MKKVVISCSASLENEIKKRKSRRESKGTEVINFPKKIEPFATESYGKLHTQFYKDIVDTDILFIMNEDKNGIEGYIWMSVFAELHFAVTQNTLYQKNKKIFLLKSPSPQVGCYEEIMLRKELWRIQIWLPTV